MVLYECDSPIVEAPSERVVLSPFSIRETLLGGHVGSSADLLLYHLREKAQNFEYVAIHRKISVYFALWAEPVRAIYLTEIA